jgi:hypothetical protein
MVFCQSSALQMDDAVHQFGAVRRLGAEDREGGIADTLRDRMLAECNIIFK